MTTVRLTVMVHAAVAFARTRNRMSALACTSWAF
jgi:TPP-dependent trihydroxycyclohexane-1,2-dione (THcHDO) dehydratase